jgi:hypothetical protein
MFYVFLLSYKLYLHQKLRMINCPMLCHSIYLHSHSSWTESIYFSVSLNFSYGWDLLSSTAVWKDLIILHENLHSIYRHSNFIFQNESITWYSPTLYLSSYPGSDDIYTANTFPTSFVNKMSWMRPLFSRCLMGLLQFTS